VQRHEGAIKMAIELKDTSVENPVWAFDPSDPAHEKCARAIWAVAEGLAGRFLAMRGNRDGIGGYSKDDLAGEAVLHVLVKIRSGKLRGKPENERWPYIKKIMWNRMLDLESRKHEIQSGLLDTDKALEAIAADEASTWAHQNEIRRVEIRALENFIDDVLRALPRPLGFLLQLHYGMYRDDDFGSEFPHTGDPVTLQVLVEGGFGESQDAVFRRIQDALRRLRTIIIQELSRHGIRNLEGYKPSAPPSELPKAA
jgi:hypothetical protein